MVEYEEETPQLRQYLSSLQRYSRFLTKNKWDADDIVQETVLKAITYYRKGEVSSALLNKIAYHHWIDTIRKRKREVTGIPEDAVEDNSGSGVDRLMDTVKLLVKNLTPKQAVIFLLKEGFCYQSKEIADLLETTEMAVKSILHRAKKRLELDKQLQSVDSYWNDEDRKMLFDVLYESLQAEDPTILIDCISKIPAVAIAVPECKFHSNTPHNLSYMAA